MSRTCHPAHAVGASQRAGSATSSNVASTSCCRTSITVSLLAGSMKFHEYPYAIVRSRRYTAVMRSYDDAVPANRAAGPSASGGGARVDDALQGFLRVHGLVVLALD